MINCISTPISFGRQAIEKFNVNKISGKDKIKKVPVTVYRLDAEDYKDSFCYRNTKHISIGNYFKDVAKPYPGHTSYIIEKDKNGKLLGAAECIERNGRIYVEMIGTSKNTEYKGLGRALLAGIAKDSKGKFPEIGIHSIVEGAGDFYKKCHFNYYSQDNLFCLDDSNYDRLIGDAKKLG